MLPNAQSVPSCLLVIPCYRDKDRLLPFLKSLLATLPETFAIQVVDDGSGKEHANTLKQELTNLSKNSGTHGALLLDPLLLPKNCGKGAAVRTGWANCERYDFAGFADADGAVGGGEIMRGYEYLRLHCDKIDGLLGTRVLMLGRTVERNPVRHIIGRVFATIVSILCGLTVYDTQCGFKLFQSRSLAKVISLLKSDRFSFDVELILQLQAQNVHLHEFPVDWFDQAGSKVKFSKDIPRMLLDVWRTSRQMREIIKQSHPSSKIS